MKEESEREPQLLPEWTLRGGSFRPNFGKLDVPTPWTDLSGRWKREELVPYGKTSAEYREQFYQCPECRVVLVPSEKEYEFRCSACLIKFGWSFGGPFEK